jgi:hypothetical protein
MVLPKLAPAVIRRNATVGRSPAGVRPSAEYFQSCTCTCANGNTVCGEGEAKTLMQAQQGAHASAAQKCEAQGSTPSGTPTYSPNACP